MNTTFKIGDTVELIERYEGYAAGSRAVIYHTDETYDHLDGGQMLCLDMEDGNKVEGMFSKRAKLVETRAHEYKQDDRVQITIPAGNTDTYGGRYFVTGGGTVLEVDVDGGRTLLQVKADTKHPLRKDGQNWWVDTKFVTPLAVELPFEVGARVRSKAGYLGGASEGIVTRLEGDFGGDIEIAWGKGYAVAGLTLGARRSGLEVIASPVVERPAVKVGDTIISKCVWGDYVAVGTRCIVVTPNGGGTLTARVEGSADTFAWYFSSESEYELVETKSKAIPATETKPQIGDTIVAFWGDLSKGEVETRAKGVVARIDEEGNYEAADGSCIDWDEEFYPETSDSVFIVERAPKPEPVKVLPEQFLLDAPVGSKATHDRDDLQYIKTGKDEWMLVFGDKLDAPRSSAALAAGEGYSKLYTFS